MEQFDGLSKRGLYGVVSAATSTTTACCNTTIGLQCLEKIESVDAPAAMIAKQEPKAFTNEKNLIGMFD